MASPFDDPWAPGADGRQLLLEVGSEATAIWHLLPLLREVQRRHALPPAQRLHLPRNTLLFACFACLRRCLAINTPQNVDRVRVLLDLLCPSWPRDVRELFLLYLLLRGAELPHGAKLP